jgi:quercetin dioxygenase-like cupin family protein
MTNDTGLTEPQILSDMIKNQADSIVSKVLSKNKSGSVTLFAFSAGQELSEHTSPFEALIYLIDGQAEITIGGAKNSVRSMQIIKLPASIPHAVKAVSDFKMLLIMIKG